MITAERANELNLARIRVLLRDADAARVRTANGGDSDSAAFYAGMVKGLERAIDVLEGRG